MRLKTWWKTLKNSKLDAVRKVKHSRHVIVVLGHVRVLVSEELEHCKGPPDNLGKLGVLAQATVVHQGLANVEDPVKVRGGCVAHDARLERLEGRVIFGNRKAGRKGGHGGPVACDWDDWNGVTSAGGT